jgi:hypothetical protein
MIPLFLDLELSESIKAQALVTAIGWVDLEKSLTISLAPSSLATGSLSLIMREDMGDYMGELINGDNDRVALVTGIRGVPQPDKLLHQSLDRFVLSDPIVPSIPPNYPPIPAYCP